MIDNNGKADPGPPYAFVSSSFLVLAYRAVLESLELNAAQQSKGNLKLGPLFRKVADDFREFNRHAEPGWLFQAPEVNLRLIRLASNAPIATSLSQEAIDKARAAKEEAADPIPNDRLKIVTD